MVISYIYFLFIISGILGYLIINNIEKPHLKALNSISDCPALEKSIGIVRDWRDFRRHGAQLCTEMASAGRPGGTL